MPAICRLCLKESFQVKSIHETDSSGVSASSLVKALIPELYLGLSVNPVVCSKCYGSLRRAYIFRLQCLRSENLIGIYVRETKHSDSTIILDDVVKYWKEHYKNRPMENRTNLEEWFGNTNDNSEEPIILNQTTNIINFTENDTDVQDDLFSEQHKRKIYDIQKDIFELQKDNTIQSTPEKGEGPVVKDYFSVSELETKDKDRGNTLNITSATPNVQTDIPSDSSVVKQGPEKRKNTPSFSSDNFDTLKASKDKTTEKEKTLVNDKSKENLSAKEFDDYIIKSCLHPPVNQLQAATEPVQFKPVRTYTKKYKVVDGVPNKTVTPVISPVMQANVKKRINLIPYDAGDKDLLSLVQELQKDENLKKLGLNKDNLKEGTYILKKIIDKTDNSISFALLPRTYVAEKTDTNKCAEDDRSKEYRDPTLLNAIKPRIKSVVLEPGKKPNESVHGNIIKMKDIRQFEQNIEDNLDSGQNDEEYCQKNIEKLFGYIEEANRNVENSSSDNSELETQENVDDEESLDHKKPDQPTHPPEPASSDKTSVKLMPIIRVRPVSALQKVRTLNHELWPQKPTSTEAEANVETPSVYKMPAKLVGNQLNQQPIVLNSKLGPSDRLSYFEALRVTPVEPSQSSLPIISPLKLKTYAKKSTDKTQVPVKPLTVTRLNAMTFKTLGFLHKQGKLKLPRACADGEPTQTEVSDKMGPGDSGNLAGEMVEGRRRSRDVGGDDLIDIKDEPLDITESDVLDMLGFDAEGHNSRNSTESEGEQTRSASETSFMDTLNTQTDLLKSIMANIPEVGEEQYDEPEYIHINNVSFSDLAKLVDESKKHMEEQVQEENPETMNLRKNIEKVTETKSCASGEPEPRTRNEAESGSSNESESGAKNESESVASNESDKSCFVPDCKNTSKWNPTKIFVAVPEEKEVQEKWFDAIGIDNFSSGNRYFCCEDHFNIEEDLVNIESGDTSGIVVKKGVVPTKFSLYIIKKLKPGVDSSWKPKTADKTLAGEPRTKPTGKTPVGTTPLHTIKPAKTNKPIRFTTEQELDTNDHQTKSTLNGIRHCFVPGCFADSRKYPNKIFVIVPMDTKLQRQWFRYVGRKHVLSKMVYYCCEDHFDVEKDLENYTNFEMFGIPVVNRNIFPHKNIGTEAVKIPEQLEKRNSSRNKEPQLEKRNLGAENEPQVEKTDLGTTDAPTKDQRKQMEPSTTVQGTVDSKCSYKIHRHCFVPTCFNNTLNSPKKVFVMVPMNKIMKKMWFKSVNRHYVDSETNYFCCEDHFKMQNFKEGVVPHDYLPSPVPEIIDLSIEEVTQHCFVFGCTNNSEKCPDKIFVKFPIQKDYKKKWLEAIGRRNRKCEFGKYYCCEDHFDITKDAGNYPQYKAFGCSIIMKREIVPHKNIPSQEMLLTEPPNKKRRKKYT